MTIFRSIFILFCMVLLSAAPLRAGVVDIAPTHDAQVVEGRSTTNYGDRTNIYLASAAGGSYKNERGWLRFDLTKQVPPGATIVSAKLRFYCYSADSDQDMEAAVHGSSDDTWQEMAINWSNQPAFSGTALDQVTLKAGEQYKWIEWDVTSFVTTEQSGDRKVSLVVKPATEGSDPYETYAFDSKEYNATLTPRLRVEYAGANWTATNPVKIFHLNDAHSRLLSHEMDIPGHDDLPGFEKVGGAAYMAARMLELKTASPNSLILDAGDISEGNPIGDVGTNRGMVDFYSLLDAKLKALGGRGIDAVVVGNHDVRDGQMLTNMQAASFPFISMNLYGVTSGAPVFDPYVTVTVNGTKIGVIGFTNDESSYLGDGTQGVVEVKKCVWDDDDASTLNIKDMVQTLRTTEGCDIVILLSHIGQSRVVCGDDVLIEDFGGVDPPEVVVSGHWHSITEKAWQPAQLNNKTLIVEAASYMQYIGELEITEMGKYVQAQKHIIRNADITPDPDVETLISDLIAEYNLAHPTKPLDEVIGYSGVNLSMDKDKWWTLNEYPWSATNAAGAWITDAMQWKALALGKTCDLAIQSGGGIRRDVPAGWITYAQIYEAYPWQDDNMVTVAMTGQQIWDALESLNCGASISSGWKVTANDGVITSITYNNGTPLNLTATYHVAVSEYMAAHEEEFNGTTPVPVGYSIRDSVVDYTRQFNEANPLTIGEPRYDLNTEFAGGFRAVVTMMADSESQPYYEAAFVRLISATEETTLRRGGYGLSDLVNADGSINASSQLSEIMLYRSHLGLRDGHLKPGDIIEIWGEGGFYAGNPQFVDQEGIYGPDQEFNIVGHDPDLAKPEYMASINDFMNDEHENHLVKFYAVRTGANTVQDMDGTPLTLYKEGGYFSASLPGSNGDILELIGLNTMRFENRRFRLREAALASDNSIVGVPPSSKVNAVATFRQTAAPLTLAATVSDYAQTGSATLIASTSFEEPSASGIYTDTMGAGSDHALVNNAGQSPVNYTATGGELGFSAYYTDTRGDVGLTDGDWVGVNNYTSDVGSFPDGSQGYKISDPDGKMTVTLDTVDISSASSPKVSLSLFVNSTTWESTDVIRIWVTVDGGTEIDLLNTAGSDIDNLGIEGAWQTLTADLTGYTQATLRFELDSNSSVEDIYIDNVRFEDSSIAYTQTDPVNVEFFYRYSLDTTNWSEWTSAGSPVASPWQQSFTYPQGYGYYEFASRATDSDGNVEDLPVRADTRVQYTDAVNDEPDAVTNPSIPDGATGVSVTPRLTITVSDPEKDLVDVSFYDAQGNLIGELSDVASGQDASVVWEDLEEGTQYCWYVVVNDGVNQTQFETTCFTTEGDAPGSGGATPVPAAGAAALLICLTGLALLGHKRVLRKN